MTAPRELCLALKKIYQLDFVPIPFLSQQELLAALACLGSNLGPWFDELWEEYTQYDSVLAHDGEGNVYRFIRTTTILIAMDIINMESGLITRYVLRESVEWPDGRVTERRYNNTMSEKWKWHEAIGWILTLRRWRFQVRRAVLEEAGVYLEDAYLLPPLIKIVGENIRYFKDPETGTRGKIDVKKDDLNRPGVITYNRLVHVIQKFDTQHWRPEYREEKHRHGRLIKTMVHTWERAVGLVQSLDASKDS